MESIGCMASSIAHDFNNVLFVIDSSCELLTHQPLTETEGELVTTMRGASDSGRGLVARLMAFARDQGCQTCELELDAAVQRAQPLMKRLLSSKIQLKLQLGQERGTVEADPTQLEQILLNLVNNAGQAIDGRGQITVSTSSVELAAADALALQLRAGPYLALSVEDSGCGIDPAVLPRIFDPFFTTKGEGGTGLGLATVQKLVRDMGGAISVWSERSRGTRFTLFLPSVQPAARSLTLPPPAQRHAGEREASGARPRPRTSSVPVSFSG
jgi:signal transduction histidine kinase